jgi:hypothetical protein
MANTKIPSELIADSSITAAKLADGTITTADIADSNVTTAKIADSNVTTAKIGDAQVTTAKITDANVTTGKIADDAVTTAKMASNSVTSDTIASGITLAGTTSMGALGVTGNIAVSGTVDGIDIAARDAVLTSTTTTAGAALPKAGGTMTGVLTGTEFNVGVNYAGKFNAKQSNADAYGIVLEASANDRWLRMGHDGTTAQIDSTYNASGGHSPLEFLTSGVERIHIATAGKVGIGTTTPMGNLSVTGSSAAVGDQGIFQITDGTGANTDTKIVMGVVASDYGWIQAVKPGTNVFDLVLQPNGGKVGIGTTDPGSNHAKANNLVVGSGAAGGIANFCGTAEGWYAFSRSNANNTDAYDGGMSYNQGADRALKFHTNAGAVRMRIDGSGDGQFYGSWSLEDNKKLQLGASADLQIWHDASDSYIKDVGTGNLLIQGSDIYMGNTSSNHAFVIRNSGNVGIGITGPSARLDVRGGTGSGTHTHAVFTGTTGRGLAIKSGLTGGQHNGKAILDAQDTESGGASMDFQIGGTTKLAIDNSGNVSIAGTPSSAGSGARWLSLDTPGTNTYTGGLLYKINGTVKGYHYVENDFMMHQTVAGGGQKFYANAAVAMTLDSTGRLGINRVPSVGSSKLEIGGADNVRLVVVEASGHTGGIGIQGGTASNKGFLLFSGGQIKVQLSDQTNVAYTADGLFNANARPSKYKTTAAGQMLLGYQDNGSGLYSGAMGLEYDCVDGLGNTSYVGGFMMKDTASGTVHLRINTNGNIYNTNNTYTSISDSRIKSDIIDASSQWDDIKALRVRKYKLAHQPAPYNDQLQIGVIAQELESAGMNGLIDEIDPDEAQLNYAPELVGEKVKTVKYSVLYMKAIKALQEAMTRIETLEAKVATLEAE